MKKDLSVSLFVRFRATWACQRGFVGEVFSSIMDAVEWIVKRDSRGGETV